MPKFPQRGLAATRKEKTGGILPCWHGGKERLFASFTNLKISAIAVPDAPL